MGHLSNKIWKGVFGGALLSRNNKLEALNKKNKILNNLNKFTHAVCIY